MSAFKSIKLTGYHFPIPLYIPAHMVEHFFPDGDGSQVVTSVRSHIVRESCEEIAKKLEDAGAAQIMESNDDQAEM